MDVFAVRRYYRALLLLILSCIALNADAVVVSGFFQSEQAVESQSSEDRQSAIKKGFEEILIKLAGHQDILLRPELRVILQKPGAYVQKFNYFIKNDQKKQSWIRLVFDGDQIEQIFYTMKLPLWAKDRPPVMIWFGIDDGQLGRAIITDTKPKIAQYKAILQEKAQRRGLSLHWPTLDKQDNQTASITDLWSMDMAIIANASRRYSAQLILLGKATRSPSQDWYSQWGLEYEGRAQWFEGESSEFNRLAEKIIDSLARELSSAYAIEVGHDVSESLVLEIEGVISLKDYADVSQLLEGLLPISHFVVKQVLPNSLQFELEVQGGVKQLITTLKLQRRLRALPQHYQQQSAGVSSDYVGEKQGDIEAEQTVIKYRWFGS